MNLSLLKTRFERIDGVVRMLPLRYVSGLNIVEPVEAAGVSGIVVNLASWSDDSQSGLEVHEPEATDVVITLELRH